MFFSYCQQAARIGDACVAAGSFPGAEGYDFSHKKRNSPRIFFSGGEGVKNIGAAGYIKIFIESALVLFCVCRGVRQRACEKFAENGGGAK